MTRQRPIDQEKVEAFIGKALSDASATYTTMLASLGDRLGLFKDLATNGPAQSGELAARTGINERYAREWLGGMAASGYLEYDPEDQRFALPPEHAPALAHENGPFFFGGIYQMMPATIGVIDQIASAFRTGGGVAQASYDEAFWDGLERFTGGWFENLLVQQWVPAMPDVQTKLQQGALVADVGCGRGRALIKLAEAYPNSRYVGFDVFGPALEKARENAEAAGVADKITFRQLDVSNGLPEKYDVITTFDVIHDSVDPLGLLRSIHEAFNPDGIYVCLDINSSDKLEENISPLGALFHGLSVFYCMTTSLSKGGAGLGTLGFHEHKVRDLCKEAGFSAVKRLPLENPFNIVYEIRP